MNYVPLGLLLVLCGAVFLIQGRIWQERSVGRGITVRWTTLPTAIRRIFRASDGPLMVGPLPTQLWGVTALTVGLLIVVGVIPSGQPAALALIIVLGPGAIALGLATLLTRASRSPRNGKP